LTGAACFGANESGVAGPSWVAIRTLVRPDFFVATVILTAANLTAKRRPNSDVILELATAMSPL